ncbi:MAG: rhomboid family protein [Candidatus Hydrogenedentes bacterium]|nr:rhomboid family protein [Candidatus Hydrogenedentota bacterium]
MLDIARQRCFNHPAREAVARCPECRRFFCRECVTDHEGRAICASCLARLAAATGERRRPLARAARLIQVVSAVAVVWAFFYLMGRGLLTIPAAFHEGTLWKASYWEEQ